MIDPRKVSVRTVGNLGYCICYDSVPLFKCGDAIKPFEIFIDKRGWPYSLCCRDHLGVVLVYAFYDNLDSLKRWLEKPVDYYGMLPNKSPYEEAVELSYIEAKKF